MNTDFTAKQATRINRIEQTLRVAETLGYVYNVDYNDAKSWLNDAIYEFRQDFKYTRYKDVEVRSEVYQWLAPYMHQLEGWLKKLRKDVDRRVVGHEVIKAYIAEIESIYLPLAQRLLALKPKIKLGRKPPTTPSSAPARTLENTGTCGICGKNVKMTGGGRLVDHGFTLRGFRSGRCFGVGHQPIEVSSDVLVEVLAVLRDQLAAQKQRLRDLPSRDELLSSFRKDSATGRHLRFKRGEEHFAAVLKEETASTEGDIRFTEMNIQMFQAKLDAWVPGELPR